MNEEFVHRNVYDIEIRRIDEKINSAVERMEARTDAYMARVDGAIAEIRGELKAMNVKISNMGWSITLIVGIMGLVLTGVSIYFSLKH